MENDKKDWKNFVVCYECGRVLTTHGEETTAAYRRLGSHPNPIACSIGRKEVEAGFEKQLRARGWKKVAFTMWTDSGETGFRGACDICDAVMDPEQENAIISLYAVGR